MNTRAHRCQNCGKRWNTSELHEIKHLWERVDPGEPMPSGQCPECGALCRPDPRNTVVVEVKGGLVASVRAEHPERVYVVVDDRDVIKEDYVPEVQEVGRLSKKDIRFMRGAC